MDIVVEVGDWEHECCGPAYERNKVIDLTCLVVEGQGDVAPRYVETHHDLTTRHRTIQLRGRVVDLCIEHPDGTTELIERLPSGDTLRRFDDVDEVQLVQPYSGELVVNDSSKYFLTIST